MRNSQRLRAQQVQDKNPLVAAPVPVSRPDGAAKLRQSGGEIAADLDALTAELHQLRDRWTKAEAAYASGKVKASNLKAREELGRIIDRMMLLYDQVDQLAPGSLSEFWSNQ